MGEIFKTLTKENLLDVRAEEEVQLADFLEGEVREGSSDDRSPEATPPVILIFRKYIFLSFFVHIKNTV